MHPPSSDASPLFAHDDDGTPYELLVPTSTITALAVVTAVRVVTAVTDGRVMAVTDPETTVTDRVTASRFLPANTEIDDLRLSS